MSGIRRDEGEWHPASCEAQMEETIGQQAKEIERLRAKLNSLTVPLECAECERLREHIRIFEDSAFNMPIDRNDLVGGEALGDE